MLSFTSDSDRRAATRASILLLALLMAYFSALETVTAIGFPRINHYWRRIRADQHTAALLRPALGNDSTKLLIVGNSLLLWAVDREQLQHQMPASYSLAVLPIENTNYLDWYFGLRRLFAEGSRPDVVMLCVSTRQLISDRTLGEPFAHSMMLGSDLLYVKREVQLDNTIASGYFFAHFSGWLGYRSEVHNWLLQKVMPDVETLTRYLPGKTPPMPPADFVLAQALPRLRALDKMAKEHRARFVLLIPPTFDVQDSSIRLREESAKEGISVILPFEPAQLSPDHFQEDRFHLNSEGAVVFTQRVSSMLRQLLSPNSQLARNDAN
jgi:hypothetical protein